MHISISGLGFMVIVQILILSLMSFVFITFIFDFIVFSTSGVRPQTKHLADKALKHIWYELIAFFVLAFIFWFIRYTYYT